MANKRVEGQFWIDRNAPHGLKYHTGNVTYQLTPEKIYEIPGSIGGDAGVHAGSLIAIKGEGSFKLAQFPRDIDRVIGICPIDIPNGQTKETSLLKSGTIVLPRSAFRQIGNEVDWDNTLKGAPVYWFIGRSYFNSGTHTYVDPKDFPGMLTLATPSGMRWKLGDTFNADNSLNVGYSNLPTVGTVVEVGTDITVNISISKFESELEWHWPYCIKDSSSNLASTAIPAPTSTIVDGVTISENILSIRHGLFCKSTNANTEYYAFRPRCYCNILAMNTGNDDTEHVVFAGVDNYYGNVESESPSDDKRTDITFKGYDGKRIYVSGKVVYTFDKQYD